MLALVLLLLELVSVLLLVLELASTLKVLVNPLPRRTLPNRQLRLLPQLLVDLSHTECLSSSTPNRLRLSNLLNSLNRLSNSSRFLSSRASRSSKSPSSMFLNKPTLSRRALNKPYLSRASHSSSTRLSNNLRSHPSPKPPTAHSQSLLVTAVSHQLLLSRHRS